MESDQMRFIFQRSAPCTHTLLLSVLQCLDPINQKSHQQQIWCHHMNFSAHPHIYSYLLSCLVWHECVCMCVYTCMCIYIYYSIYIYIYIHKRKKNRYETLCANCVEKGWICHVIPIEVGCRGFIGHSVILFLSKIGITGHSLKVASNCLQTTAQYASSWIWSKARSFQHEGNTHGTTFPVWLRKKRLL